MNWDRFISAFDESELGDLRRALWKREDELAQEKIRAGAYKLTAEELALVAQKKFIDAIKAVRTRTNLTLLVAKKLVDFAAGK